MLVTIGCAGASLHQRIAPYPGYGQPTPQQYRDGAECEAWARSLAGSAAESSAGGAAGGALVGAATGAALGAIAGAFFGAADSGAALGAALGGASGGLQGAAGGAVAQDERLTAAYTNCMAAHGYVVTGTIMQPVQAAAGRGEDATAPSHADAAETPGDHAERRLLRLRELHHEGLITDGEYRDRRRAVLEDL
jgi:hypothetical protein